MDLIEAVLRLRPVAVSRLVGAGLGFAIGRACAEAGGPGSLFVLASPVGAIVGYGFGPRAERGDALEAIAARMGVIACVLGAALSTGNGGLVLLGLALLGPIMLIATVPAALVWAAAMRSVLSLVDLMRGSPRDDGDVSARTSTTADGARIGVGIGLIATAIGFATTQWWSAAALPAGGLGGAAAARWIRSDRSIPVRAVATAAVVATVVGSFAITFGLSAFALLGDREPTLAAVLEPLALGALGLLELGIPALIVIAPTAWLGAVLLRRRLRRSAALIGVGARP